MKLDEIKKLISSGQISRNRSVIDQGDLPLTSGDLKQYKVFHGWDFVSSLECDEIWGRSNIELFEFIEKQNFDDEKLEEVLSSIQKEDHHWNWFKKSIATRGDEYEWFYLYVDDEPQAACLIYHPRDSALQKSKIFYVEFLAVAPWNRSCLVRERKYLGVGSVLLKTVLNFAVHNIGLSPGFSLHSLPQASGYYSKLNMVCVDELKKDTLLYFELPKNEADKLLGVV